MILEIRDLSCRYVSRRKDTLSHVDLSLAEGEMVLIAGRSGCGKSTLIKSITGLLEPGGGTAHGDDLSRWAGRDRDERGRYRASGRHGVSDAG